MGVRGLKSFIQRNDDLLIKEYRLYNTFVVIDACNLIAELIRQSQRHERPDLFGGNMVQFGQYVNNFFDNLNKCNIRPILVFDGAQTRDVNMCKTREKLKRAIETFHNVMSINKLGFGDFILPLTATNVFRSIAVDKNIQIIQCMYEADLEVARLAHKYKCPVISNDSDFYLIDLPFGLIPTDQMNHKTIIKFEEKDEHSKDTKYYILCDLFKQENFVKYFPKLDKKCLPLLGILVGNDYIQLKVFDRICSQLPLQRIYESYGSKGKQFKKITTKQHEKILKILYYLCDKSLNETINQICLKVPKEDRQHLKKVIKSNLVVYEIPSSDNFKDELSKLYKPGFYTTYSKTINNRDLIELKYKETLDSIVNWLRLAMERSVLSYRCLELAHRNKIFLRTHMGDPSLPSAHKCHIRCIGVMLQLLRSSQKDNKSCLIYDRLNQASYGKMTIYPIDNLQGFGPIDYIIYDIPKLSKLIREQILLTTFYSSLEDFSQDVVEYYDWFDTNNVEEFLLVKILMKFIDVESSRCKLWKQFKHATLICIIYYHMKTKRDARLLLKLNDCDFIQELFSTIDKLKLTKTPQLGKKRLYNCRLMHQISQLQTTLTSYNLLNAFLGDVFARIRSENWLNCCLLYNLTECFRQKRVEHLLKHLPYIIIQ